MDIDEKIFYYLWKSKKKYFSKKTPENSLKYEQIQDRLSIISSLLSGQYTKVKKGTYMAGLVGDTMFFSPSIFLSENLADNELAYLHQICFSVTAKKMGYVLPYNSTTSAKRLTSTVKALPFIIAGMKDEYPSLFKRSLGLYQIYLENQKKIKFKPSIPIEIKIDNYISRSLNFFIQSEDSSHHNLLKEFPTQEFELQEKLTIQSPLPPFLALLPLEDVIYFHREDRLSKTQKNKTEEEQTVVNTDPKDIIRRVELNENENTNPASLLMEGVQTTDIFSGGHKRVDGSDELKEHGESLDGLNIQEVVRTDQETNSIFKADIVYEIEHSEDSSTEFENLKNQFLYNEWDYKKRKYFKNWCCLQESKPQLKESSDGYQELCTKIITDNRKQIEELRHQIEKIFHSRRWKNRQRSGDEIDIDSYTDGLATMLSGQSPDEKFYMSKRKRNQDISLLILLDASLSSDSWIDGQRVLDITKELVIILQAALKDTFEKTSVMAFNGKTRRHCKYFTIKDFDDSWSSSLPYLMALEPADYTRIGVAVRHSIAKINKVNTRKKAIILLSDGKPTDYDAYEGKHGIQDVKRALDEAQRKGIDVFSLAIDREAKYYFPQMFGKNNFRILNKNSSLPKKFMELFSRLI